jgi:hypothetical protein
VLAIALALGSSLVYGVSDFLGGLKSKSLPLLWVLLISQGSALVVLTLVVLGSGDGPPSGSYLAYGWHAVSGFFVAVPALLLATRPHLVARFLPLAAGGLIATAIWALFSTELLGGLFYFPNNGTDALLHLATSTIFLAGAAHYFLVKPR